MSDPITKTAEQLQRMAYLLAVRSITDRGFHVRTSFATGKTCTVELVDTTGKSVARGVGDDIAQASSVMVDDLRSFFLKRAKDMSAQAAESMKAADRAMQLLEEKDD